MLKLCLKWIEILLRLEACNFIINDHLLVGKSENITKCKNLTAVLSKLRYYKGIL